MTEMLLHKFSVTLTKYFPSCWLELGPESNSPGCFLFVVFPKQAASTTSGNLLECKFPGPTSDLQVRNSGNGTQ